MKFKNFSAFMFMVFLQRWENTTGQQCGTKVYDPTKEYCLENGSVFEIACRIGYCRRADNTCHPVGDGNNCETNCHNITLRNFGDCFCLGPHSGDKCEKDSVICRDCTYKQLCIGNAGQPCFGDIGDDFCNRIECKNGGTCVEIQMGYICKCANGYTGKNCEMKKFGC